MADTYGFGLDDAEAILAEHRARKGSSRQVKQSERFGPRAAPAAAQFVSLDSVAKANVVVAIKRVGGTQNQIQSVYVQGATAGTFTLTFDDTGSNPQTTSALAWNIGAIALKAALDALSNITSVTVTGAGTFDSPFLVTFTDALTNYAAMTFTSSLTPIIYAGVRVDVDESTGTWSNKDNVFVRVPNSETLAISTRYLGKVTGVLNNRLIYRVQQFSKAFSGAAVRHSSTQTIANATFTVLSFDTEEFDIDGYHDNAINNSRFTVPSDGYYLVGASFFWESEDGGIRLAEFLVNGAAAKGSLQMVRPIQDADTTTLDHDTPMQLVLLLNLAASDYVQLRVYQDRGAGLSVDITAPGDSTGPYYWITKLG